MDNNSKKEPRGTLNVPTKLLRTTSAKTATPEDAIKRLHNVGEELVQLLYLFSADKDKRRIDSEKFEVLQQTALGVENEIKEAREQAEKEGKIAPSVPKRYYVQTVAATPLEKLDILDRDIVRIKNLRSVKEDKDQVNSIEELRTKWETVIVKLEKECTLLQLKLEDDRRGYSLEKQERMKLYNEARKKYESTLNELKQYKESEQHRAQELLEKITLEAKATVSIELERTKHQLDLAKKENQVMKQTLELKQMEIQSRDHKVNNIQAKQRETDLVEENKQLQHRINELTEKIAKYRKIKRLLKKRNEEVHEQLKGTLAETARLMEQITFLKSLVPKNKLKELETMTKNGPPKREESKKEVSGPKKNLSKEAETKPSNLNGVSQKEKSSFVRSTK